MIGSQIQIGTVWRRSCLGFCLGGVMMLGGQAAAQVILNDTFSDGDRTNSVSDPLDIAWFSANGATVPVNPEELPRNKPELTVLDDSLGLGSGNAMFVEAVGIGSEYVGIFPEAITLGSNIGDQLVLSFDWRVWYVDDGSGVTTATAPDTFPYNGELRFGLYEDTQDELDRVGGGSVDWGNTDGLFDGDQAGPGAGDDVGVFGRLGITPFEAGHPIANARLANIRISQESGLEGRVLGGNDMDYIAQPIDANLDTYADTWPLISNADKFTIKLILERVDVVNTDGDNILYTMEIYDSTGTLLEGFGDTDAVDDPEFPLQMAPQVDSFDYMILVDTVENYDSVIDNVKIELIAGVISIPGDLNNDGFVGLDDLDIVLTNWNQNVPPANAAADPSGDGYVGLDDLDIVLNHWNQGTPPSALVPEPATLTLLGLGGLAMLRRR